MSGEAKLNEAEFPLATRIEAYAMVAAHSENPTVRSAIDALMSAVRIVHPGEVEAEIIDMIRRDEMRDFVRSNRIYMFDRDAAYAAVDKALDCRAPGAMGAVEDMIFAVRAALR
jgi:hypothetical protein